MTVQTELRRVVQTGNGATSTFYFNAPVLGLDDLDVYTVTTAAVQTLQTRGGAGTFDYTMTINASTKYATVTLNNNLTNGFKIVMLRSTAITQGVDYVEGDPFLAETHEGALDRLTLIATQLQEQIDRSVKVVETSTTTGITVQELAANAVLVVNAGATGFEMGPTPSSITASATAAAASASAAASSASAASTSASNASTSATNASASAGSASTSATSATASASSATSSASAASTSATNAATSASGASTSATNAASSASAASTSASNASTSATNASNSASTATTQATNAASSATASANSATSAAASAASAAALLDNFDDRYLGAKASDPSLDNDGNALAIGALYFNTTDGVMKVYTASGWIAASSASVATLATFEFVATSGQTVFSGNDANGVSLSYVAPAIIVTLNGVRLRPGDDYTATNGTSLTLVSAAALNDELVVDAFGAFLIASIDGANIQDSTTNISKLNASGTRSSSTFLAGDNSFKTVSVTPTAVSDQANSSTGYFDLPSGTTAQRPGSPTGGMIRHNTNTGLVEFYDTANSAWTGIGAFTALGGNTVSEVSGSKYHIFTSSGSFIVTQGTKNAELLIVAGGGGGGSGGGGAQGGGGGAGGYVYIPSHSLTAGTYTVTVGAGGSTTTNGTGGSGGDSSFASLIATGGGGGGGGGSNPNSGGSGGGVDRDTGNTTGSATQASTVGGYAGAGFGNNGGNNSSGSTTAGGGGGGGANAVGGAGQQDDSGFGGRQNGGDGGAGKSNNMHLGTTYTWAGGGGGSAWYGQAGHGGAGGGGGGSSDSGAGGGGTTNGGSGLNTGGTSGDGANGGAGGTNTGGGGGAGYQNTSGAGGSGIVIVRYSV
jgi:hypothetical protein